MTQILFIGDIHYKHDNWEESLKLNEFILSQVKKLTPDLIIVLGDVLHTFRKIDTVLLNLAISFFEELSKYCPIRILIGNHDRLNNSEFLTPIHPFVGVKPSPSLAYVWKVEEIVVNELRIALVPYVYPGRLMEALETKFKPEEIPSLDLVAVHQEIRGSVDGAMVSKKGDVWPTSYPMLVSGHIHKYQRIGDNVIYVGTPRMVDFGDSFDKTISLFTREEKKWVETRIEVPLPKRTTLRVSIKEVLDNTVLWVEKPLRIQIEGTKTELEALKTSLLVGQWKKEGIKIQPIVLKEELIIKSVTPGTSFLEQLQCRIGGNPEMVNFLEYVLSGC